MFYIFHASTPGSGGNKAQLMGHVSNKHLDNNKDGRKGQRGRSRKLAEWQQELVTSLESRPEVRFRRVRSNELVIPGDYIQDGEHAYQPWEGPRGFRAASFRKPVFRPEEKAHT